MERSEDNVENSLNLTAEDNNTEENKKQPISSAVISLINESTDMTPENKEQSHDPHMTHEW